MISASVQLQDPLPPQAGEPAVADASRIAVLFNRHYDAVWRTLRRLGVSDVDADDAAQRVFVVATRRLDAIVEADAGRYLYGIALRVASEVRRRNPARRDVPDGDAVLATLADDASGPEQLLLEHELMTALDAALADMPDDLREVLVLSELEGLSSPEVALLLAIPVGTVASRLRRAREAFTSSARRVRARLGLSSGGGQ